MILILFFCLPISLDGTPSTVQLYTVSVSQLVTPPQFAELNCDPGDTVVSGYIIYPDVERGDDGNDNLKGQKDDDLLDGGLGADQLRGGSEIDTCITDAQDTVVNSCEL